MFETAHRRKMFLVRLKDVYYASEIKKDDPNVDVVYYFFCREPHEPCKEYLTAVVDLSRDEEEILRSFRRWTRQMIKRIKDDENLEITVLENPEIKDLLDFQRKYEAFSREKGFFCIQYNQLETLRSFGRLKILNACYENELITQRVLVEDDEKIVPYCCYTNRLNESNPEKIKTISCINKMVEYYSMVYWKDKGKKYYDLGGLFTDKNDEAGAKVNHYKDGFRGEHVTEYEFIYPTTRKGQLFCWLKEKTSHRIK